MWLIIRRENEVFVFSQEIISQIMNVEATIARARSLKAKFGIEKCTKEEERKDLEK